MFGEVFSASIIILTCVAKVIAGKELLWYVILSQWTCLYKLSRNDFSWHSIIRALK